MSRRSLEQEIQDAFDGEPADETALRAALLKDPQAVDLWCDYAVMESELRRLAAGRLKVPGAVPARQEFARRQGRRKLATWLAAAAAVVIAAVTSFVAFRSWKADAPPLAKLQFSTGTVLRSPSGDLHESPELAMNVPVHLVRGVLQMDLGSGTRAVIEGPAKLTWLSAQSLELEGGHAWLRVPTGQAALKVTSPELEASFSSGGEYGLDLRDDMPTSLHAFSGSVEARSSSSLRDAVSIAAGDAASIIPGGRWDRLPADRVDFLDTLPAVLPMAHMSFDAIEGNSLKIDGSGLGSATARAQLHHPAGARLVPGVRGMALELNGTGAWIETNWSGISGTAPRTVSLWCLIPKGTRIEAAPPFVLWGNPITGWNRKFKFALYRQSDGRTTLRGSFGERLANGQRDLADGEWHHLAMTYRPKEPNGEALMEFYIDGEAEPATFTGEPRDIVTDTRSDTALGLTIGRYELPDWGRNPFLKATIDELRIHSGALDAGEIRELAKQR